MTRRTLILAIPQLLAAQQDDPWKRLEDVWNPFALKMNKGIVDLAQWKKIVREVEKIQGATCR